MSFQWWLVAPKGRAVGCDIERHLFMRRTARLRRFLRRRRRCFRRRHLAAQVSHRTFRLHSASCPQVRVFMIDSVALYFNLSLNAYLIFVEYLNVFQQREPGISVGDSGSSIGGEPVCGRDERRFGACGGAVGRGPQVGRRSLSGQRLKLVKPVPQRSTLGPPF